MTPSDPLRTTELLALIEEATTPVRHDVRNRIASVRNLAFFVRRKLACENSIDRDPRINEFLLKIEGEVQRTDEVIDAWTTKVQGLRPFEESGFLVGDAVRLATECARLPAGITLLLTLADDSLRVDGDLHFLAHALRCLLENAGEAMGSGQVTVRVARDAEHCCIVVVDQGPGIADGKRVLERFVSSKPGHLGLGLCIARRIVTRFGGELVIGNPELGAEVGLRIPMAGHKRQIGEEP